jgi:hypothetical protein
VGFERSRGRGGDGSCCHGGSSELPLSRGQSLIRGSGVDAVSVFSADRPPLRLCRFPGPCLDVYAIILLGLYRVENKFSLKNFIKKLVVRVSNVHGRQGVG